jgi:hypothetical protein
MHRDHRDGLSRPNLFETLAIDAVVLQTPGSVCLLLAGMNLVCLRAGIAGAQPISSLVATIVG